MKAVLELELIADNLYEDQRLAKKSQINRYVPWREELNLIRYANPRLRPWVARLIGLREGVILEREFVRYQSKDYSRANSTGSKGIFAYYVLGDGVYEVNKRVSWERARRYFIRVEGDQFHEISRDEVLECLTSAA